ncbi:hypothetical protein PFICI_10178 [Pestalotiopsis fici W106-1]|uniref:EngB-type G domain-containing protein n=1 Tax=Pestalotiopsis fici (strain W106-1 / CGMCC3.15140) TaxID=1229662 RepID=W3WYZ9_PESFW|nr:uncharacterized protein PFICI_10178 [Pestalotiopsis fici W106-1]ETS78116.1 hypothetical protein PFICI_10178 [Pestalotiopsis fici W106-1]
MTTLRQVTALLALPATLRPLLFAAPTTTTPSSASQGRRCFHATCRAYARYLRRPLSVGAFTIPHSPALPLSEIPIKELLQSPKSDKSLADELNKLFTQNPATFYHGTSDFYELKKNTRIPEICILGRSNVGKSTFVNALANRRENELAHTSARAGRTKAMNAFGFGPAPTMKELADTDTVTKRTEDLPKHSFFVLDMPGYGHKSLQDWGKHINLYLTKRQAIKGAILLIDGEVGPKSGDLMALELLQAAGLKTAIVLTKADKAKHEEILKETCKKMWLTMRDVHSKDPNSKWEWDQDFFVTALGATKKEIGIDSVAIARLAVARLAGLVTEKERPEIAPAKGYSGAVVSFEDLFAQSTPPQVSSVKDSPKTETQTPAPAMSSSESALAALEQASGEQHKARQSVGRMLPRRAAISRLRRTISRSPPLTRTGTETGRQFSTLSWASCPATSQKLCRPSITTRQPLFRSHVHVRNLKTLPGHERLNPEELEAAIKEFVEGLKAAQTPMDRAQSYQLSSRLDRPKHKLWDPTFLPPRETNEERQSRIQKMKEKKLQHLQIYRERLATEKFRASQQKERQMRRRHQDEQKKNLQKQRYEMIRNGDKQTNDEEEQLEDGRRLIAEAQDKAKALRGKKLKKAVKNAEKQRRKEEKNKKKQRNEDEDEADEDDSFESKFRSVR